MASAADNAALREIGPATAHRPPMALPQSPRRGRAARGADLTQQAVDAHRRGDLATAEQRYRMVLRREPDHAIALNNLAVLLIQRGQQEAGEALVRRAVAAKPDYSGALCNLGTLLREKGDIDGAIEMLQRAATVKPDYPEAYFNLALCFEKQGKLDDAVTAFDRAIANKPAYPEAHFHRGNALKKSGDLDQAIAAYREAAALRPDFGDAYANLGIALAQASQLDEAIAAYRRAIEIRPNNPVAHANLGSALVDEGQVDEAIAQYRRAIAISPDWAHARFALSLALLQKGEHAEGWREYEWRWKGAVEKVKPRELPQPQWQGEDLSGKVLLVYAEQGLGDTLQFVRFIPSLAAYGGRVVLEVPGKLMPLLRRAGIAETMIPAGAPLPEFDYHLPLLSLPSVIGLTEATIPAEVPYLAADPERVARWHDSLPQDGFRIGIVWQGFPNAAIDKGRSIPLPCFAPIAGVPGVRLISLQKNYGLDQLNDLPAGMRVATLGDNFDAGSDAFLDTAAVMAELDLVITSDTSVAHVAGALGRPVWIILKTNPDWRWLTKREDSPWYPTARLFRQRKRGDWDEVFGRVAAELAQVVAGDREKLFADAKTGAIADRLERARAAFDRAFALHRDGALDAAAVAYCEAITLDPNHAETYANFGVIRHGGGRVDEAIALYRRAIALKPDHVSALGNLAVALSARGDVDGAIEALRQLVAVKPEDAENLLRLGELLRRKGDFAGAIELCRRAVAATPDDAMAHLNLAMSWQLKGELECAIDGYCRAIELDPDAAAAYINLGGILYDRGGFAEAVTLNRRAVAIKPDSPGANANLALALIAQGKLDEAIAAGRRASELEPANAGYHFNLSHALLMKGDYVEGWQEYEWRLKTGQIPPPTWTQPMWSGEDLGDRALLLVHEQGLGDTLQFCRYAALAAEKARVMLAVPRALAKLLGSLAGVERIVAEGDALPRFDFYCPLPSLPAVFKTTRETIPAETPYLAADPAQVELWRHRVDDLPGLRVGLVWAGNARPTMPGANAIDRRRSISLSRFAALARIPGVSVVSLQKGEPAAQAKSPPPGLVLYDWTDELDDFADTAALVEALDLVISVDTSVVHLAGALGKPVWILSRFDGCWRWLLDRDDTPWYPTARLFRQRAPGDWDEVLARVAAELADVAAGDRHKPLAPGRTLPARDDAARARAAFERGFALHRKGSLDAAANAYEEALAVDPNHAEAHSNLGVIRHGRGRIDEAITLYRRAVATKPGHASALGNLIVALTAKGDVEGAISACRQLLLARPEDAENHLRLGDLLRDKDDIDGAIAAYQQALAINPGEPRAHFYLGFCRQKQGALDAAVASYQRAVALDPQLARAHGNLGVALSEAGRIEEGIAACRQAVMLQPDNPQFHSNLGLAFSKAGDIAAAIEHYRRAVDLDPGYAEAHANLGLALLENGELEAAIASDRRAIAAKPDYAEAHFNLSLALLLNGDFAAGWPEYEWRWKGGVKGLQPREFRQPQWQGEDLAGRTLLLHAEQGLGDTLQFVRFAAPLARRGARVILAVPQELTALLQSTPGIAAVVGTGAKLPPFDFHRPLLSVPAVLGTTEQGIPSEIPYLSADPARVAMWRGRLPSDGLKIGIAWQGRPNVGIDKGRSVPLSAFAPIAAAPGVRLISLQKNHGLDQLDALPEGMRVEVLGPDFDSGPDAFLDTAAVMASLDLVITSDTSIAHLAGALGRPVWVVLKTNPDWRWLLNREDSPWYPTMRLFRQRQAGDWDEVFARVANAIARCRKPEPRPEEPVLVPVAIGELADKISILEIKAARIGDPAKLKNVRLELGQLRAVWKRQGERLRATGPLTRELKEVNERLWVIEDEIRDCERQHDFGAKFVELARAVYHTNDRRAELKREINLLSGSALIEEKSYRDYRGETVEDHPDRHIGAAGRSRAGIG